jgi:hypothetical protein
MARTRRRGTRKTARGMSTMPKDIVTKSKIGNER